MTYTTLTEAQQEQWAIDGYLVLKNVLSKKKVQTLIREINRLYRKHVTRNAHPANGMDRRNLLPDSDVFIQLMDHPALFDLILHLMGPYIQLSMAEAIVRVPNPDFKGYIHTDGGPAMRHIRVTETSWPLQIKIQYFLTDVTGPNQGNFTLFPGSHLRPFPEGDKPITPDTPGAIQLNANAGDAAIFAHSLWHGVSPNHSKRARKTLIYCYSQMCFRPFDFQNQPPEILDKCTPRQRRLLGDVGENARAAAYFYSPRDQAELMAGQKPKRRKRKAAG
ncbi:MAG: phytanoyl-CoA dioxygenase family protein [bacterium]|nr:phytanoyl-CoA dioxygenase family protein [bacterium]